MADVPELLPAKRNPLRSRWGMSLMPIAAAVVIAGAVLGVRGLLANPIVSVGANGVTTISGSFAPVSCSAGCVQGYVQAGARSVFVRFPNGCAAPASEQQVTVTGRRDRSLGTDAYLTTGCAAP
ncbi:MAG TPA: hypothetical protein VEK76_08130 [Candidatus Binatia bacterium]|nr:hypothetical protein [Candidatus Binatia bacterium]